MMSLNDRDVTIMTSSDTFLFPHVKCVEKIALCKIGLNAHDCEAQRLCFTTGKTVGQGSMQKLFLAILNLENDCEHLQTYPFQEVPFLFLKT